MTLLTRVILPFLLLVYIAAETYMKLQHTSLCDAVGCKLAGELLKFDSLYLNYFGMAGVFTLMILGFLSRKRAWAEYLFFTLLYGAVAFEATILSYQFLVNPEPCVFCMGIFSSLLGIALLTQAKRFLMIVAMVSAIVIALNTLTLIKNKSYVMANGTYLIQSKTCPHCKKVKTYFAEHQIAYNSISSQDSNARAFLKFIDINSIPVLIIKKGADTRIIHGDHAIIQFYQGNTNAQNALPTENSTMSLYGMSDDFLTAGAKDSGCALTITDTTPCDSDVNKTD